MPLRIRGDYGADAPQLFPAFAFFNSISGDLFVEAVESLLSRRGVGGQTAVCTFQAYDLDEEPFVGVKFSSLVSDEEIIVSDDLFFTLLRDAIHSHLQRCPQDRPAIERICAEHGQKLDAD